MIYKEKVVVEVLPGEMFKEWGAIQQVGVEEMFQKSDVFIIPEKRDEKEYREFIQKNHKDIISKFIKNSTEIDSLKQFSSKWENLEHFNYQIHPRIYELNYDEIDCMKLAKGNESKLAGDSAILILTPKQTFIEWSQLVNNIRDEWRPKLNELGNKYQLETTNMINMECCLIIKNAKTIGELEKCIAYNAPQIVYEELIRVTTDLTLWPVTVDWTGLNQLFSLRLKMQVQEM